LFAFEINIEFEPDVNVYIAYPAIFVVEYVPVPLTVNDIPAGANKVAMSFPDGNKYPVVELEDPLANNVEMSLPDGNKYPVIELEDPLANNVEMSLPDGNKYPVVVIVIYKDFFLDFRFSSLSNMF
jgi:hypothetical protein